MPKKLSLKRTGILNYLLKKWNIHENQMKAGQKIIHKYTQGINYCILIAQMQSGKTGTAKYVTYYLLHSHHKLGKLDSERMYYICGMNDNDLRSQAIREFKDLIPKKNIMFSKQLQKMDKDKELHTIDLLIIDESHYGSNKNSQLDKFISATSDRTLFTLSVSATPMAEVASQEKHGKALVELEPGDNYYGLADIFCNGLISQSVSLSKDEGQEFLYGAIEDEIDRGSPKYCIVRLPSQWYQSELEEDILECYPDVACINHHSEYSNVQDFNDYIVDKPATTTIIWVYNALRAGKQLNTEHIGFVYDTSESKTDVIAQSLLGRILGYGKGDHKVRCYTDMESSKKMLNWVQSMYCKESIPSGSKNIKNGYSDKIKKWNNHPPILISIPTEISNDYYQLKIRYNNRYPYKDDVIVDLLRYAEPEDQAKVEEIIDNYVPGKCGGLMILNEENTKRSFRCHWDFNYKAALEKRPVRGFDTTNELACNSQFYYIYYNLNTNTDSYSKALIVYKERINATREAEYVKPSSSSMYD